MSDRRAIVDIGSNSVRLVVYGMPRRAPVVLFNEKVSAGLGRGLATNGRLEAQAVEEAMRGLRRFKTLVDAMALTDVRAVATAAVREAENGGEFAAAARAIGFDVEILSGDAEAEGSGYGVVSTIPEADGIVGDLGGGSLELVQVANGEVGERLSLPLGVLRIAALRRKRGKLDAVVREALEANRWLHKARDLPFYLVGGSWRALGRLDMARTGYTLPVLHNYRLAATAPAALLKSLEQGSAPGLAALSPDRAEVMPDAAALLAVLVAALRSSELVVSAGGLREGLLYQALSHGERRLDPLVEAAAVSARVRARFPLDGALAAWLDPVFGDDVLGDARLRGVVCLLADVAWDANPDFRAERARDLALHESWTGIDAYGRAMIAQALWTSYGGGGAAPETAALLTPKESERARQWGLAVRLAQRLSGGVGELLARTRLVRDPETLTLHGDRDVGEAAEKRLKQLAHALGLKPALA